MYDNKQFQRKLEPSGECLTPMSCFFVMILHMLHDHLTWINEYNSSTRGYIERERVMVLQYQLWGPSHRIRKPEAHMSNRPRNRSQMGKHLWLSSCSVVGNPSCSMCKEYNGVASSTVDRWLAD
jgi:hypothetical protein